MDAAAIFDKLRALPLPASLALIACGVGLFYWGSRRSDASRSMGSGDTILMVLGVAAFFAGLFPLLVRLPELLSTFR